MPRRLSPNFWIAPVAGATFLALYAIEHLSSRQLESRRIEQRHSDRDCGTPSAGDDAPGNDGARDSNGLACGPSGVRPPF